MQWPPVARSPFTWAACRPPAPVVGVRPSGGGHPRRCAAAASCSAREPVIGDQLLCRQGYASMHACPAEAKCWHMAAQPARRAPTRSPGHGSGLGWLDEQATYVPLGRTWQLIQNSSASPLGVAAPGKGDSLVACGSGDGGSSGGGEGGRRRAAWVRFGSRVYMFRNALEAGRHELRPRKSNGRDAGLAWCAAAPSGPL